MSRAFLCLKEKEMNPIILLLILISLNAMFAATEIAVITTSDVKLKNMAENGDRRAKRLIALTEQPAKFLATIQVAITLAGLLQSAFAAESFADPLVAKLIAMGLTLSPAMLKSMVIVGITLILAYFTLVFGELVPKRVAMKKAEGIALGMSGILYWVAKICAPVVWLLTVSTNTFLKIMRIDPEDEGDAVTEESIRMMLAEGREKGTIPVEENQLIENVFEFDDITAEELCTHRREVIALSMSDSIEKWKETIKSTRYSRYPICGSSHDDVVGILDIKAFFSCPDDSKEILLKNAAEKPMLIPESMKANVLFRNMQQRREYFAVVIDEYGGMTGIVTLHDIMEAILGELSEKEAPPKPQDIEKVDDSTWKIQGCADLEDVEKEIGISLPTNIYDTFNGFVCGTAGRIPEEGEHFALIWNEISIDVQAVKNRIIQTAFVTIKRAEEEI